MIFVSGSFSGDLVGYDTPVFHIKNGKFNVILEN